MPHYQIIGRVKFYWHDQWLERDVHRRVEAPNAAAAIDTAFAAWDIKVRRGNRSDRPDLQWVTTPAAIGLAEIPIQVGDTVIRKADRAKPKAIRGTVEQILVLGAQPRHWKAAVRWHGNVNYRSGRTDQKSTLQVNSLVKIVPA